MIKVVEFFSGIGSQTQALKNLNIKHKVVGISEWSINSIISYGELHCDNTNYNLNKDQILKEFENEVLSMDTKKPANIKRLSEDKLKLLYKNYKNSNNLGSINNIKGEDFPECNLLTYSFPCQDLSNQGKGKGLYDGKSSSLLWQVGRILNETNHLPDVLLMENVKGILQNKHKEGFDKWKDFLSEKGYKNYVFIAKSSNYDIPQNRERCFMISSKKDLGDIISKIHSDKLTNKTLNDILDENIDEKYYNNRLIKYLPNDINFKKTNNGIESVELVDYTTFISERKVYSTNSISPTITATGANSRIKIYDGKNVRIITPLECWKLMGFTEKDYNKVKHLHSDSELKKQAGNSIVVNVLEKIFNEIAIKLKWI
jgi:DNA (cytosine-5)-methyltransferase 1